MILMNNDFKNSVSATEREMKGYVEITYTDSEAKYNSSINDYPAILKIGKDWLNAEMIFDNDRKGKNYASLEKNYFKLDGTFLLPNNEANKNPGIGYISSQTFQDDKEITITPFKISTSFEENNTINGLTLYFLNNKPLSLQIEVMSGSVEEMFTEKDCIISDSGIVQLMFSDRVVDIVKIYVKDVLYPERRVRLQEVDFGLSMIYAGQELMAFKTIEEIDIFNDSIPCNEIEVRIGDFKSNFDFKNKKGITKYLNNNVLIKPYVGVITNENGIEYCPKGTYWLQSYDTNGKEAVLKGKDIYSKLQDKDLNKAYALNGSTISKYLKYKSEKWGVNIIDEHLFNWQINSSVNDTCSVIDTKINNLQKMAIICGGTFNADRFGNIVYKSLYNENNSNKTDKFIKFSNMKEYPKIKIKSPVKKINVSEIIYKYSDWLNWQTFYENHFTSTDIVELYIEVEDWKSMRYPEIENAIILDSSWHKDENGVPEAYIDDTFAYIKLKCNGNVTILIGGFSNEKTETINSRDVENSGSEISISNDFLSMSTNDIVDLRLESNKIINFNLKRGKYSISLSYNGDPSTECGDVIFAENKYKMGTYDKFIITKIESEFKGSYFENIEGDIIE